MSIKLAVEEPILKKQATTPVDRSLNNTLIKNTIEEVVEEDENIDKLNKSIEVPEQTLDDLL